MEVKNKVDLQGIVGKITFGPSGVMLDRMNLEWEIHQIDIGWRVRFAFDRPDTVTGEPGRGYGRWELIERGASESSVVKTCWLLLELLVRHELMEAFQYNGAKLFDPHRTVAELALSAKRSPE